MVRTLTPITPRETSRYSEDQTAVGEYDGLQRMYSLETNTAYDLGGAALISKPYTALSHRIRLCLLLVPAFGVRHTWVLTVSVRFDGIGQNYINSSREHTCRDFWQIREWATERFNGSTAVKARNRDGESFGLNSPRHVAVLTSVVRCRNTSEGFLCTLGSMKQSLARTGLSTSSTCSYRVGFTLVDLRMLATQWQYECDVSITLQSDLLVSH